MKDHISFSKMFSYKEMVSRSIVWGHYFLILNCLLTIFIGSAYFYDAPKVDSFISFVYLLVTNIGHMAFLTFVLFLIVLFPLSFLGNYRYYRVFSVLLLTIFHILLLIDVKLFLYVKAHLSLNVLNIVISDLDFDTGLNYNFLFIAIPIVIALELLFAKLATKSLYKIKAKFYSRCIALVLIVCFICSHCIHIWADAKNYDEITTLRSTYPLHYPMTAKSFLKSHGFISDNTSVSYKVEHLKYPLNDIHYNTNFKPNNIIHIMIENLSYDDLMPNNKLAYFNDLALDSQIFNSYYLPYTKNYENNFAVKYGLPISYKDSLVSRDIAPVNSDGLQRYEFIQRIILNKNNNNFNEIIETSSVVKLQTEKAENDEHCFTLAFKDLNNLSSDRNFALYLILSELNLSTDHAHKQKLQKINTLVKDLVAYLKDHNLYDNTMLIISSLTGHQDKERSFSMYNRKTQHGVLIIKWPNNEFANSQNNNLATAYDLNATLGKNIVGITNPSLDFGLGLNLKDNFKRGFFVIDEPELILVSKQATTIYMKDGKSLIEYDNNTLRVRPNLENLIRAMHDLNRFKE